LSNSTPAAVPSGPGTARYEISGAGITTSVLAAGRVNTSGTATKVEPIGRSCFPKSIPLSHELVQKNKCGRSNARSA
jgi:hypothetical protein